MQQKKIVIKLKTTKTGNDISVIRQRSQCRTTHKRQDC